VERNCRAGQNPSKVVAQKKKKKTTKKKKKKKKKIFTPMSFNVLPTELCYVISAILKFRASVLIGSLGKWVGADI